MSARAKPDSCRECAIYSHGNDFSAIEGTGSLGVQLVGEASGEHEQRDQLPFRPYAPAGGVLTRIIRRMGFSREQFSITNVGRCRPRNNWMEDAPWEYSALAHCRPNLDAAIAQFRPRAIQSLGNIATRELTGMAGPAQGVGHLAGYVLPAQVNTKWPSTAQNALEKLGLLDRPLEFIPVVPNFHPAFLRRGKASYQGVFARHLNRAIQVASGRDHNYLWHVDPSDRSTHGSLEYRTHPSLEDAIGFLQRVRDSSGAVVSYDIETFESASLDEDAREGFVDTHLRLIQFSIATGEGIAFPWEGEFRDIAQAILHLPNTKCGHNVWLFDNKVLRAAGEREGLDLMPRGTIHDTLAMFHHWQPDLPAHLQFAASFVQFPFPWKHLAGSDIEFYGCCDVDSTLRLYSFLEATLKKDDLWGDHQTGYLGQVFELRPVLAAMEDRGMPIDDTARLALDAEFKVAQEELGREITQLAPSECGRVHPKEGYKGIPSEVKEFLKDSNEHTESLLQHRFTESSDDSKSYHYALREFMVAVENLTTGEPSAQMVSRWCQVYDFNPNSGKQLIEYMKLKKHKVPKAKDLDDDGMQKDTTNKKELVRLARSSGDTFYLKVIEFREFSKMRGTYIEGFAPGPDGRVHTTFTFDTGTGQLSARNPNVTNFPKRIRLAKKVRKMVAAPAGQLLVEWDYKSYHVVTTGFCAEDASYIRMAKLDMHSFVAWHMLRLSGADELASLPDDELAAKLEWFKMDEKRLWVRNNNSKPAILGIGFGMGYRRLYQENMEYFNGEKDAKRVHDLLRALFPKVFAWQERVKKQAHDDRELRSPFGHIRRFYEVFVWDSKKMGWTGGDQAEEAVAFLPANIAFGNIRLTMKELASRGLDVKFGMMNSVHDSLVWCFAEGMREEHIEEVYQVLVAPSKVLRHPTIAPEGLVIDVEGAVGRDWATMEKIEVGKAVRA